MYKVLYRKWRPQTFTDVAGQPHITSTLMREVSENRLAHAYLFTGSRGTGKTSCAKILAKAVNCLAPVNGNPCNECAICKGIDNGSVIDVVEIDAASNRGIEDIRALREESAFAPAQAAYRVYIIDEVHMLTIEAFNALLKTLEEPPAHVKFILATTEVQKLPSTILSRCQRFDFRRISAEDIADRLMYVSGNEGVSLTRDAAALIARISDGGMRDALSLLDRCISISDNITADTVTDAAGIMNKSYLLSMARAFIAHDTAAALSLIDGLHKSSCDSERLCSELTNYFRNILITKTVAKPEELIICTDEEMTELKNLSVSFTHEEIFNIIGILTEASAAVKKTQNRRIEAEMAVIKICSPQISDDTASLTARISVLEKELADIKSGAVTVKTSPDAQTVVSQTVVRKKEEVPADLPFEPDSIPVSDELPFDADTVPVSEALPFDTGEEENTPLPFDDEINMPEASGQSDPFAGITFDDDSGDYTEEEMPFGGEEEAVFPADDGFGADVFDDSMAPPENDDGLPFVEEEKPKPAGEDMKLWTQIIIECESSCKPLIGVLLNSTARISGNVLTISNYNTLLPGLISVPVFAQAIEKAAEKITGRKLTVRLNDNK